MDDVDDQELGEAPDGATRGLLDLPLVVLDDVLAAVPRLIDRTRAQADLVRRLAGHLPCIGAMVAPRPQVEVPDREAVPVVDVLQVAALQDDEIQADAATQAAAAADESDEFGAPVAADVPTEDELPVQDYDSLAASQVVPRLSALSDPELAAVEDYERAHRNRQTILNKVKQLQSR